MVDTTKSPQSLPVVVRQEVEVGAAENAGDDPELEAGRGRCCKAGLWNRGQASAEPPGDPHASSPDLHCPTELPVVEGRFQTCAARWNSLQWWKHSRPVLPHRTPVVEGRFQTCTARWNSHGGGKGLDLRGPTEVPWWREGSRLVLPHRTPVVEGRV